MSSLSSISAFLQASLDFAQKIFLVPPILWEKLAGGRNFPFGAAGHGSTQLNPLLSDKASLKWLQGAILVHCSSSVMAHHPS